MTAALAQERPRLAVPVLPALVLAYAISTVIATTSTRRTTYGGASAAARAADLAAALGLVGVGLLAWRDARTRRLGVLALAAAVAWCAPDWAGWSSGPALARAFGASAAPFLLPIVLQLVLTLPSGRFRTRGARATVACAYVAAACAGPGAALVRDPVVAAYCWPNCTGNALLVHSDKGLADFLSAFWLRTAFVIGALIASAALLRIVRASPTGRRGLWPALAPAVVFGAAVAAYALALHHDPAEDPAASGFATLFLLRALSLAALAAGLAWSLTRVARSRVAVMRLSRDLGDSPAPGALREALGAALGDPRLEVVYPLADGRFVDGRGRGTQPPSRAAGRAITPITRGGQQVVLVGHDAALLEGPALERELGAAARVAVENERLQAEVLAQLDDLRASRTRIVVAGDAARRQLERDLHDGAQQRLVALSYDLRLARSSAATDGDDDLVSDLDTAIAQTQGALAELRELAQGIYPAILAEAGLAVALHAVAESARLPLELRLVTTERFDAAVEAAAYVTVTDAIADAVARGASYLAGRVEREEGQLVVELEDDGSERPGPLSHAADRIGALAGHLETGPSQLRAEIPCA